MDKLLRKKYNYNLASSFESTKMKMQEILTNKWYDLSKPFYGNIEDDGTFSFKQKFVFLSTIPFGEMIYLKGKLTKVDRGTLINITLSPNLLLVFLIYLFPLLLLNIFFGDNSILGSSHARLNNARVVLFMELVLFIMIQIPSYLLRRKFEKAIIPRNHIQ
jgi:hypothetical protein